MKNRLLLPLFLNLLTGVLTGSVFQGNGIKVGEVTADSAVLWTRLTAAPEANWAGTPSSSRRSMVIGPR